MSGGHLDYIEWKILEVAKQVKEDMLRNEINKANGEKTSEDEFLYKQKLLEDTLRYAFIIYSYEWAESGDTSFEDFIEDYKNANSENPDYYQKYKEYFVKNIEQLYMIKRDWHIRYTKEITPSSWENMSDGNKRYVYGHYEQYYYNPELKHWDNYRYKIENKSLREIIECRKRLDIPFKEAIIELAWD
jgi:hypothetical protein